MRLLAKIGSIPTNRVNLQLILAVTDTEKDAAVPQCGRQRAGWPHRRDATQSESRWLNYVRIPVRSSTLLLPLSDVADCRLTARCLACRVGVDVNLGRLVLDAEGLTVGQAVARLVCSGCGAPPVAVALVDDPVPGSGWVLG